MQKWGEERIFPHPNIYYRTYFHRALAFQSFGFWSFAFRSFPLELDFSKIDPPHQGGKRIADRFASSLCALERAKREIVTGRLSRERDKGGARVGLTLTAAQV